MLTPDVRSGIYLISENKPPQGDIRSFILLSITGNLLYRLDAMGDFATLLANVAMGQELVYAQSVRRGVYLVNPIGRQAGRTG